MKIQLHFILQYMGNITTGVTVGFRGRFKVSTELLIVIYVWVTGL